MPKNSKVGKIYDALLRKGMSKEKAARISQAETNEALATGRAPKHKRKGR